MIPKELLKKIRHIEIFSSKVVNHLLAGEYHSVFKGHGMEFDEVREYQPGDEARSIDWNVTARMGRPFIKRYVEERELSLFFLVDLSASGLFGSIDKTKSEAAAEVCAMLAFSAIKNNDKVGLVIFTDQIELFVPPAKGPRHVLRIIRDLLLFKPSHSKTDIRLALEYLGRLAHRRSVVFLVSDFQSEGYEHEMSLAARKHDLIAISLSDRREGEMPDVGLIELQDAESGETRVIDMATEESRRDFKANALRRADELRETFVTLGVDNIEVGTDSDYVRDLIEFFRTRERRQTGEFVR